VLEGAAVKASYDRRTDTLSIVFRPEVTVESSEEVRPGVVMDFDDRGRVVSLEILDASHVIPQADRMEFEAVSR
jgi:uncharacterized protein YuzE